MEVQSRMPYYTIANGGKAYLPPELQKALNAEKDHARYYAMKAGQCGQPDYHRCQGDCFLCPWHRQGFVLSTDHEKYFEGITRKDGRGVHKQTLIPAAPSTEQAALDRITVEAVFRRAAVLARKGDQILRLRFERPEYPTPLNEIADRLGMSKATVYRILTRLLMYFREHGREFT